MKSRYFYIIFITLMSNIAVAHAGSLLKATQFPTTATDLSFTERMEIEQQGYEPYAGLSAYYQMALQSQEDAAEDAIELILQAAGISDDKFMTPAEESAALAAQAQQIVTQSATTSSSPTTSNTTTTSSPTASTQSGIFGYCSKRHPEIVAGQNIPFGLPVYTGDLKNKKLSQGAQKTVNYIYSMFCDSYRCRQKPNSTKTRPHRGIDLGCKGDFYQMPVYATADGVVQKIVKEGQNPSAGNFIRINHGGGWVTQYMHLDKMFVTDGQQVSAGCLIGLMGHTGGNADYAHRGIARSNTHLHYGIIYSGSKTQVTAPNGKNVQIKRLGTCTNGKTFLTNIDPHTLIYYK